MHVDHLIYAAPDLEAAVADLADRLGVRAAGGGQHVGQGTHNRLLALGPRTYLEIVAPDPRQPEPGAPRPYGVDGVTHPGLVGWALECEDVAVAVSRARESGFDPGDPIAGQRLTPEGTWLRWRLSRNALAAGVVPFLISWGDTEHPAATAPAGLMLVSVTVEHPNPDSVRGAISALGGHPEVRVAPRPALVTRIRGPRGEVDLR